MPGRSTDDIALFNEAETLLLDGPDQPAGSGMPAGLVPNRLVALGNQIGAVDCAEMAEVIVMWATCLNPSLSRRQLLQKLSVAFALADVQVRLAPSTYRQRAVSVAAELNQLVGWCCFNAGDYRGAQHYFDEARGLAHDAHNVELVTYVLCTMSHHAVAAQAWATQSGNPRAVAYAADVAARAFAADRQPDRCRAALDDEQAALTTIGHEQSGMSLWYFFDESFYCATASDCALGLGDTDAALDTVTASLRLIDPSNVHNYAFTMLIRAEALVRQGDVTEASGIVRDAAALSAVHTARRIRQKITDVRTTLTPWQRTKPVRELDEVLMTYGLGGRGNT